MWHEYRIYNLYESIESATTTTRLLTGGTCLKILLAQFPVEPTKKYVQAILIRHNGDKNVILFTSRFYESRMDYGRMDVVGFMSKHCVLLCMMGIVSVS